VKDEESVIYFKKDKIPEYDDSKTYYMIIGSQRQDDSRPITIEQVKYAIGDYLVVKCFGADKWYAICGELPNDLS
jgi:hypothetical protein